MGLKPSLLSNLNITMAVFVILPLLVGLIGVLVTKLAKNA